METQSLLAPQHHWLLDGVPLDNLQPLLASGGEARYLPGDVIFREGDAAEGLYLVLAGSVRVTATSTKGETVLSSAHQNEVVGEMGVLDGQRRSATAMSMAVTSVYFLPTEPFLDLLERSPAVCMRLLAVLTSRLRAADARLAELPGLSDATIEEDQIFAS
jgi:CRP/FNR family transcriptional regulator, cyclic AMP receptor protein